MPHRRVIPPYRCAVCGTARVWKEDSACNRCQRERLKELEGEPSVREILDLTPAETSGIISPMDAREKVLDRYPAATDLMIDAAGTIWFRVEGTLFGYSSALSKFFRGDGLPSTATPLHDGIPY